MSENSYVIPAVARATRLLRRLCESELPLGVSELSRDLEINKNMVFRLLHTLEAEGWVIQDPGPKYRVSLMPFAVFSKPAHRLDPKRAATGPLRELWEATGEACYLAVLDGDRCLFVEHLDSTREVRAQGRIGGRYALHCCAPGKALLAHAGNSLQDRVLQSALEANTSATITRPGELRRELTRIQRQGYAVDIEEYSRGMMCLAAPVVGVQGNVVAAVGLTGLTLYYTQAELESVLGPNVLWAARATSKNLGAAALTGEDISCEELPCTR